MINTIIENDDYKKLVSSQVKDTMNFLLEATPDAEIQIIFDEKIGDVIKGRGNGNIQMTINTLGD